MNGTTESASPSDDARFAAHVEHARRLLSGGDPGSARALLEELLVIAPHHLPFWLSLAAAFRVMGQHDEELRALEHALAIDPTHLVVLLQKAALLDLINKPRSAAGIYAYALQSLAPGTRLPAALDAHVRHAERRVQENAAALGDIIDTRLSMVAESERSGGGRARFDRCLDRVLGRRRIYVPEPSFMLFPFVRHYEFFEREQFPWIVALEAETESICQEMLNVLSVDQDGIEPYIAFGPGVPIRQWQELNHSRRWSAYFLWNQGRREASHLDRCPRTARALSEVPQVDIPGRGPTAFFSILDGHTKIPLHTGVTNTRLTVHLPLVVPPACGFRVGGETREWRQGKAWVFDDTIEHEAWNDSDSPRAILIFDVWNPELTVLERNLVRETTIALADYYEVEGAVPGVVQ